MDLSFTTPTPLYIQIFKVIVLVVKLKFITPKKNKKVSMSIIKDAKGRVQQKGMPSSTKNRTDLIRNYQP